MTAFYQSQGVDLGEIVKVLPGERKALGGGIVICPPSAIKDVWAQKFPNR